MNTLFSFNSSEEGNKIAKMYQRIGKERQDYNRANQYVNSHYTIKPKYLEQKKEKADKLSHKVQDLLIKKNVDKQKIDK